MPRHAQQHIFVLDHPKQHLRKNKKNCQIKVLSHKSNPCNEAHNQTIILDHISISFKIICLNLVKSISDHVLYLVPPIWPQSAKLSLSLLLQLGIRSAANVDLELAAREKPCLIFHIKITVILTMTVITVVIGFCEHHFTIHNE